MQQIAWQERKEAGCGGQGHEGLASVSWQCGASPVSACRVPSYERGLAPATSTHAPFTFQLGLSAGRGSEWLICLMLELLSQEGPEREWLLPSQQAGKMGPQPRDRQTAAVCHM